jgi:hypothetical protein
MLAGETPSTCGVATALGMAKIATIMAMHGTFGGHKFISEETWQLFHSEGRLARDSGLGDVLTKFTRGGVNIYDAE